MSTLISYQNNGDLADVEFDFLQVTSVLPNRKLWRLLMQSLNSSNDRDQLIDVAKSISVDARAYEVLKCILHLE
jgi:hypothetical protein